MLRFHRKSKGFTLIELMIVVAIIGILAAVAIPRFANLIDRAKEAKTQGNLGSLRSALVIYYGANEGLWPSNLETLATTGGGGPFIAAIPESTLPSGTGHTPTSDTTDTMTSTAACAGQGEWYYDPSDAAPDVKVNCAHTDSRGDLILTW